MHPTIQYQLAQTIASDRIETADRRSRSIAAASDRDRPARRGLHRLVTACQRLARGMTRPVDLSTER